MGTFVKFSVMILASVLAFSGVYFLKITLNQTMQDKGSFTATIQALPQLLLNGNFWLALLSYGSALTVYLFLLNADEVSKTYSIIVGMNVLLTAIGATILLGDTLSGARILGVVFIIIGIVIINGAK